MPYREHDTGAVGTYDAADPENDTILWSLRGTDRNDFTITGGVLRFVETPDLEDPVDADPDNEYRLTVRASDGEYTDTLAVTVRVSNEEEAGAVSFSSEQPQVDALLTATLTDPDGGISGDEWTWERPQNGSSWTAIAFATSPCYPPVEADLDHYLRVTVSYSDGHGPGKEVVASPDNRTRAAPGNDAAPFFTGSSTDRSVDENSPAMTAVGAPVSATDLGGDTLSGTTAGLFTVDGGTGQIRVKQGTLLDYEEGISYSVTLTASDPANAVARIVVFITVNDVNEAPVAANDEVMTNEDTPATMIPVLANDSDPDPDPDPSDVLTVSSHTTPANGSMTVEEVGNTITYTPRADFHGVYTFTYTASGGALSAEASAIVTVRAVNDAPEFPLSSDQRRVATNTAPGTEVGSPVEANDRDGDTPTYDLAGADASSFEIDQYTRQITVGAGTVPDPTMQASYEVTVTAADATYAYDLKTGERLQDREFELGERNRAPRGGLVRQDDHLDCGQWLGQAVRPSARDG